MLQDGRQEQRHRCRIRAEVYKGERATTGQVRDLSASEIGVDISRFADIEEGDIVDVHCIELGMLQGRVKWRSGDRIGVTIDHSSNTNAKFSAYFRYFDGA